MTDEKPAARFRATVRAALDDLDAICDDPPAGLSERELIDVCLSRMRILSRATQHLTDALMRQRYTKKENT